MNPKIRELSARREFQKAEKCSLICASSLWYSAQHMDTINIFYIELRRMGTCIFGDLFKKENMLLRTYHAIQPH